MKRLLSHRRRYSGNNGCCEQRYKRRAWFVVVVFVVGCSPFSLQMVSSADTCLFMSPSVPRTVDATSSERNTYRAEGAEWDNFTVSASFGVSWVYKVSRKPRYSLYLEIECLEVDCFLIGVSQSIDNFWNYRQFKLRKILRNAILRLIPSECHSNI